MRVTAGLLLLAVMVLVASASDASSCRCASCGAAICRSACRTDCNKCCRCCIYFEMRVGRRADVARQLRDDPGISAVASRSSAARSLQFG